jgi:hypothetical protein
LPDSIGGMTRLKTLNISDNSKLSGLPAGICLIGTKLQNLRAARCKLARLPDAFGSGLSGLRTLDLEDNDLECLPDSFGGLTRLTHLRVNRNRLKTLPESIGALGQLRTLFMGNNPFESYPFSVGVLQVKRPFGPYKVDEREVRGDQWRLRKAPCKIHTSKVKVKDQVGVKLVGSVSAIHGAVSLDYSGLSITASKQQKQTVQRSLGSQCSIVWES